jgi:hypothetical protein
MKRKQVIVLGLVLVIIAVGILQYNLGGSGDTGDLALTGSQYNADSSENPEDIPGAAVYVNSDDNPEQAMETSGDTTSGVYTGYFAEARIERDRARSRQKEELRSLVESGDTNSAAALEAQEKLMDVINRSELETTIETLIKQRGFADALVYISDNDYIDVIVNANSLSEQQVAIISDIVVRHAQVPMENITVKNVN